MFFAGKQRHQWSLDGAHALIQPKDRSRKLHITGRAEEPKAKAEGCASPAGWRSPRGHPHVAASY
jgi:hypothetical protein